MKTIIQMRKLRLIKAFVQEHNRDDIFPSGLTDSKLEFLTVA